MSKAFKKTLTHMRAFGLMDNFTSQTLSHLIQKPPERRSRREIDLFLPTLITKANCLKAVDKDAAADILKFSEHKHCVKDEVIVKQGDVGNTFFIIIKGAVAVRVKENIRKKSKKSIIVRLPSIVDDISRTRSRNVLLSKTILDTADAKSQDDFELEYGPVVNILGAGYSFGEMALLGNIVRNATIIAEEPTDLLVISRSLFENTIQTYQSKELDGKKLFVRTHPFFSKWSDQHKDELVASLKKTVFYNGQCAFKQGEEVTGLHFLVGGKARLSVDPELHKKQFPEMMEAIAKKEHSQTDQKKMDRLPSIHDAQGMHMLERAYIRRIDGYAAAERFVSSKKIEICSVQAGEIINDVELLLGLKTHILRVFCSTTCDFYSLEMNQFERLVMKKNANVLSLMKTRAETKLIGRISSIPGKKIELFPLLLLQLRYVSIYYEKRSDNHGHREHHDIRGKIHCLPLWEVLEISNFCQGGNITEESMESTRKETIPKHVKYGPDYYKKLMRKRFEERQELRQQHPEQVQRCIPISKEMKEMILNNVRQRIHVENVIKKLSLGWALEGSWMSRWK